MLVIPCHNSMLGLGPSMHQFICSLYDVCGWYAQVETKSSGMLCLGACWLCACECIVGGALWVR